MTKARLEAFSDGVLAIIITIMVLEIKVPHSADLDSLIKLSPIFICYLISFFFVGIYWLNHHHLLHTVKKVNSGIIWANMGLLFALSLIPFSTGWMGENHYAELPVLFYSINLFACGLAAYFLQVAITRKLPPEDKVFVVIKTNLKKTIISVAINILAISFALYYPLVSLALAVVISAIWVIPDRRIEKLMEE